VKIMSLLSVDDIEVMLEEIRKAKNQMIKAIETLNLVANKDRRRGEYYRTYIINHLEIRTFEEHGFASADPNLDDWIEELIDRLNDVKESEE
jgi:hypothetical protein